MEDVKSVSDASEDSVVQDSEENQTKEKKDKVSYDTYKRTVGQLKKVQEKLNTYEEKLSAYQEREQEKERQIREAEERKLEEKGEFKKLLELKEKELAQANERLNAALTEKEKSHKVIQDTVKLHAFYEKLPGKIKKREYLNFVDLDNIVINPETQEVENSSVDSVVNSFLDQYGELVDTSHVGRLPAGKASSIGSLDYDNWKKRSSKEMKKDLKEMVQLRLQKQK